MDFKEIATIGGFLFLVGGHIVTFLKAKGMDEAQQKAWEKEFHNLHEIDEQQWKKIDELKRVGSEHEKEDWKMRGDLELKIATTDGNMGKLNGRLDSIEKKLDKLIDDFERKSGRN